MNFNIKKVHCTLHSNAFWAQAREETRNFKVFLSHNFLHCTAQKKTAHKFKRTAPFCAKRWRKKSSNKQKVQHKKCETLNNVDGRIVNRFFSLYTPESGVEFPAIARLPFLDLSTHFRTKFKRSSSDCYALALLTPHLGCARNFLLIISKMTRQLFFLRSFSSHSTPRDDSPQRPFHAVWCCEAKP